MAKRKKKTTSLPRITLMAYNRRDLLAFVEAVNKLSGITADLLTVTERVKAKKKPAAAATLVTPTISGME